MDLRYTLINARMKDTKYQTGFFDTRIYHPYQKKEEVCTSFPNQGRNKPGAKFKFQPPTSTYKRPKSNEQVRQHKKRHNMKPKQPSTLYSELSSTLIGPWKGWSTFLSVIVKPRQRSRVYFRFGLRVPHFWCGWTGLSNLAFSGVFSLRDGRVDFSYTIDYLAACFLSFRCFERYSCVLSFFLLHSFLVFVYWITDRWWRWEVE